MDKIIYSGRTRITENYKKQKYITLKFVLKKVV